MNTSLRLAASSFSLAALAACAIPPDPSTYAGIASSYDRTAGVSTPGSIDAVSIDTKACEGQQACQFREVTFTDGPMAGRTLTFAVDGTADNLAPGETAFLETLGAGVYESFLIGVETASGSKTYAVYDKFDNPTLTTGSASFVGTMIAEGHSPTGSGLADGTYSAFVSFVGAKVIGQMNTITFRNGGTFPVIQFTADLDYATGDFVADTISITGAPTTGHLEGGLFLPGDTMHGVFSVNSGTGPDSTSYNLTGIFQADEQ